MELLLFFMLTFLLASCKTQKIMEFTHKQDYSQGNGKFTFSIKNISNQDITLVDPLLTKIEHKNNSRWRNIRILYCPCGASCPQPPKEKTIKNNEIHQYKWSGIEEWCGEINSLGMPESMSKTAKSGLYRIKIVYKIGNRNRTSNYYKFKIK